MKMTKKRKLLVLVLVISVITVMSIVANAAIVGTERGTTTGQRLPEVGPFEVITPSKTTPHPSAPPGSGERLRKPKVTPIKANVPAGPIELTPLAKKTGKHDPSIDEKLSRGPLVAYGLPGGGKASGVKVWIYLKPEYFKGKNFKDAIRAARRELESAGVKLIEASANPIVGVVTNENVLEALENLQFVAYIRDAEMPLAEPSAGSVLSEGVYNISADYAWNKGYDGSGIKAAILDIYTGGFTNYQTLVSQGELPSNTQIYTPNGAGISTHGSVCGEVIYDVAPGIEGMYLAVYANTLQMYNATKWLIDNGVRVVSHSVSDFVWGPSQFDADGDGNAEFWDVYRVIQYAIDNNVVWVNSAGNYRLQHWEGDWTDQDNDGYLDIYGTPSASGIEYDREAIQVILNSDVSTTFIAWIRWSDYPYPNGGPTNDFNAYLQCWNGSAWETVAGSTNNQTGQFGQEPLEIVSFDLSSKGWDDGNDHYCMLVVTRHNATNADQMHFDIWWTRVAGYWYSPGGDSTYTPVVEEGSVTPPADHPGVITVGAVPWTSITTPEGFSSMGPAYNPYLYSGTWLKPNVVAPDAVSTVTYSPYLFGGTSAATSHVAGVVADVLSANPYLTPIQMMVIIQETAKDINATGPDYYTGYGLVNASDATPQRIMWLYPTPEPGAIIDVQNVILNLTTMYKKLSESNLSFDGSTYQMNGDASRKIWTYELPTLPEGVHTFNATTLDSFNIWIVRKRNQSFYINLGEKTAVTGIDGDAATGPGGGWADSSTVSPNSSAIINGTFVWKDASDGGFTSGCTGLTYDITELQLRADTNYIYVIVKLNNIPNFGKAPAPIVGVGFDIDNNGTIDYTAYAYLDKVGVSAGLPEFLDVYDSSWDNVANNDPTHTLFVANDNIIEMQIPRSIIGNPSGSIGLAAWVYEGLGGGTICSGYDIATDSGNVLTTVDLAEVPFLSNIGVAAVLLLLVALYVRRE